MNERRLETTFSYDYWQFYLYDAAAVFSPERREFVESVKASQHGLAICIVGPLVNLPMATQYNFKAPIEIVVAEKAPAADADFWDHIIEFDLDLPSGRLMIDEPTPVGNDGIALPAGLYRARFAGKHLQEAYDWESDSENQPDAYRLQLWPREQPQPPAELKRWPGYDGRI